MVMTPDPQLVVDPFVGTPVHVTESPRGTEQATREETQGRVSIKGGGNVTGQTDRSASPQHVTGQSTERVRGPATPPVPRVRRTPPVASAHIRFTIPQWNISRFPLVV